MVQYIIWAILYAPLITAWYHILWLNYISIFWSIEKNPISILFYPPGKKIKTLEHVF